MKSRDIKALPIVDHGDTDAVFIDDVAAIIERGDFSQVICLSAAYSRPRTSHRRVSPGDDTSGHSNG